MAKETSICGVTLFTSDDEDFHLMYSHINELIKLNIIKPVLGKTFKLEEAAKAHHEVVNNDGSSGRLTILID